MSANQVLEDTMIKALNIALLKEGAVQKVAIGGVLFWDGKLQQVDITEDGRKIAYPLVR